MLASREVNLNWNSAEWIGGRKDRDKLIETFPNGVCLIDLFLSLVVNVMQRDSIPSEVDYETRQGVYSICLQLARYVTTSH